MEYKSRLQPILKWVGGKRQLLPEIEPLIPKHITTYVEPFLGGGSLLFSLQPKKAIVNDYNKELINVYRIVKEKPEQLILNLKEHEEKNEESYYYNLRELDRDGESFSSLTEVDRAARIIYLNKTCFNGIFRVNSKGHFNTPYGRYDNPNIVNEERILAVSKYLNNNNIKLLSSDYKLALKHLRKGAFVYFDPPYMADTSSSSFTGYTANGFDQGEQERLKGNCDLLNQRKINFLLSNSDTDYIRELYKDYNIKTIQAKRLINSKSEGRGEVNELLIYNYNLPANEEKS